MSTNLTAEASGLAHSLSDADVPPAALDLAVTAFVDTIGCAIAGADSADAGISRGWIESLGGNGESTLIATAGVAAPASLAALANGVAGHALDLDDFSSTMMHPSVCLVPALLAVGEREGSSGREVTLAYVAGFEIFARLCRVMNPGHYARGWHATSTVGAPAVAAAVARLLGLDPPAIARAMAIAASTSSGLRQNFGSMVKPYHAGNAAFHGVASAELAARGFSADESIHDGPRGLRGLFGGDPAPEPPADLFDGAELELGSSGIAFKRYACCGAIHAALDATLELRTRHGLTAADVASVRCAVNRWAPEILIHQSASTPSQGRFCIEYSLAAALVDGDAGVIQYTDARLHDAQIQDISRRVQVAVDEGLAVGYSTFPAAVTIETTSGASHTLQIDVARGNMKTPFTREELDAKFRSCASLQLRPEATEELLRLARGLLDLDDVGQLARATAT
jgi:2-methylcitrate dehydratase PrpD